MGDNLSFIPNFQEVINMGNFKTLLPMKTQFLKSTIFCSLGERMREHSTLYEFICPQKPPIHGLSYGVPECVDQGEEL